MQCTWGQGTERLQQCAFPCGRCANAHVWCLSLRSICSVFITSNPANMCQILCQILDLVRNVVSVFEAPASQSPKVDTLLTCIDSATMVNYDQKSCLAFYMCHHIAYQVPDQAHVGVGHNMIQSC